MRSGDVLHGTAISILIMTREMFVLFGRTSFLLGGGGLTFEVAMDLHERLV